MDMLSLADGSKNHYLELCLVILPRIDLVVRVSHHGPDLALEAKGIQVDHSLTKLSGYE